MKEVKIVRVAKGQEAEGAKQIADFYNEMEKQNARTSRAIITSVGDDIVYTVFADVYEEDDGPDDIDDFNGIDDKDDGGEDEDDDEDFPQLIVAERGAEKPLFLYKNAFAAESFILIV